MMLMGLRKILIYEFEKYIKVLYSVLGVLFMV